MSENGAPKGGVDMQSVNACACFVRTGRCCLGSLLGSILGSFWEPSSPLYSTLEALGCTLVIPEGRKSTIISKASKNINIGLRGEFPLGFPSASEE